MRMTAPLPPTPDELAALAERMDRSDEHRARAWERAGRVCFWVAFLGGLKSCEGAFSDSHDVIVGDSIISTRPLWIVGLVAAVAFFVLSQSLEARGERISRSIYERRNARIRYHRERGAEQAHREAGRQQ